MHPEYYPDLKKLVGLPEWATYQKLLEAERESIIRGFENGDRALLPDCRNRMDELKRVMRLPHDLIKEHEANSK